MASWQNYPSWSQNGYSIPQQPMFIQHLPVLYGPPLTSPTSLPPANTTPTRSTKYPSLNPILAEDTAFIRFDLKQKPSQSIDRSIYYTHRPSLVFLKPTQRLRLISKSFPWTIDIDSNVGQPITVGDVWEAMYEALQIPIVESEWGFVVRDEKLRTTVENAMKKRAGADPMLGMADSRRPKRIDLLGDSTLFRGLERDDEFAKSMLLPSAKAWSETWVIKLIA